jgi:hypothetical protein
MPETKGGQGRRSRRVSGSKRSEETLTASGVEGILGDFGRSHRRKVTVPVNQQIRNAWRLYFSKRSSVSFRFVVHLAVPGFPVVNLYWERRNFLIVGLVPTVLRVPSRSKDFWMFSPSSFPVTDVDRRTLGTPFVCRV